MREPAGPGGILAVWIRWDGRVRRLVDLLYCQDLWRGFRGDGVDDEGSTLFEAHPGAHAFGFWCERDDDAVYQPATTTTEE
ncbi:hypothetical protein [Nonomuraea sp. NPDC049129]|uniref:hypothetical protein n=1 Tax=Nonomuraea sp. NPDC049129 TaxID=3155272 RepID=UPI0033DE9009